LAIGTRANDGDRPEEGADEAGEGSAGPGSAVSDVVEFGEAIVRELDEELGNRDSDEQPAQSSSS